MEKEGRRAIVTFSLDLEVERPEDLQAQGLGRRLLGAEPGGEVLAWASSPPAGIDLAGREEARRESWPPPDSPLQPLDLEQVDSDLRHRGNLSRGPFRAG